MLSVDEAHAYYGNIHALKGVSLEVPAGEIVGLIGGNGAGKSTLLKVISGLLRLARGKVSLQGKRIDALSPATIVRLGVSQVPEGRRVFPRMTVLENLLMGAYAQTDSRRVSRTLEQVFALFPILRERQRQLAGTLSGGEQQMLAIGRGLMSRPQVLLLDEPSMGLAPLMVENITAAIREINSLGTTVLLVEQKAPMAFRLARHVYVMETGRIVLSGSSQELSRDDRVKRVYLGQR